MKRKDYEKSECQNLSLGSSEPLGVLVNIQRRERENPNEGSIAKLVKKGRSSIYKVK